jgi:acyl carrier protein
MTEKQLISIVAQILSVESSLITEDSGIGNPQEWDSFAQISIMLEVEREIIHKFSPEEISENSKIKDILNLINETI